MKLSVERAVLTKSVQENVETQLRFYYPEISKVEFSEKETVVTYNYFPEKELLTEQVIKIIDKFKSLPAINQKVYFDSEKNTLSDLNLSHAEVKSFIMAAQKFIDFIESENGNTEKPSIKDQVLHIRKGLNIYNNETALLFSGLDVFFREYYRLEFSATELKVPSMIPSNIVDQAGYFETGCQHISFVAPINNNPETFENFYQLGKTKV